MRGVLVSVVVLSIALITGCATKGERSVNAKPVFYPNAHLNEVGKSQAQEDAENCIASAKSAGLTPEDQDNATGRGAAKGAAVGATAGAVGAVVHGKGIVRTVERGVEGAVVGAATGAVAGSFHEKPSGTFRHFVNRCLKDKGFEVIGWN